MSAGIKRGTRLDLAPLRESYAENLEKCLLDKDDTVKRGILLGSYARGRRDLLTVNRCSERL